jgi:hypothetical protein
MIAHQRPRSDFFTGTEIHLWRPESVNFSTGTNQAGNLKAAPKLKVDLVWRGNLWPLQPLCDDRDDAP